MPLLPAKLLRQYYAERHYSDVAIQLIDNSTVCLQLVQTNNLETIPQKGKVVREAFPCYGVIVNRITEHDDVIKWKHFPRNWQFVRGIHRSPVNSPHKGQWRGALMFSLTCVRINDWVNNREAGDLRRYRAHYDVIVMRVIGTTVKQSTRYCLFNRTLNGVV